PLNGGTHQSIDLVGIFSGCPKATPQGHRRPRFSLSSSLVKEQISSSEENSAQARNFTSGPSRDFSKENPEQPILGNPVMNLI
ncbi:hypothetical protein, partial [Microvirga rosea]|uniref:hypothetical protein n=1 Tax=Microvirga rosea TaxID=2715425 RepID=UPI001D0AC30A